MDPEAELMELRAALRGKAPAPMDEIRKTEHLIDFVFPPDLAAFFALCDGGEGWWGENYLRINSLEDIRFENTFPEWRPMLRDVVVFGRDGGGESYAFLRGHRWTIVERDLIAGADSDHVRGTNFLEFIRGLKARPAVPPSDRSRS